MTINQSTQINARALNTNGEWSPIVRADFTIGIPNLRVVELHYNPADPTAAEITACQATSGAANDGLCSDNDEYEFVEIQNTGTRSGEFGRDSLYQWLDVHVPGRKSGPRRGPWPPRTWTLSPPATAAASFRSAPMPAVWEEICRTTASG